MKSLFATLFIACLALTIHAGDKEKKTVTLEGSGTCAKCTLGSADSCTSALVVKDAKGEATTYLLTSNMLHGKYFCKGTTEGLVVTGTVEDKDGQLKLTPHSIEKKDS